MPCRNIAILLLACTCLLAHPGHATGTTPAAPAAAKPGHRKLLLDLPDPQANSDRFAPLPKTRKTDTATAASTRPASKNALRAGNKANTYQTPLTDTLVTQPLQQPVVVGPIEPANHPVFQRSGPSQWLKTVRDELTFAAKSAASLVSGKPSTIGPAATSSYQSYRPNMPMPEPVAGEPACTGSDCAAP